MNVQAMKPKCKSLIQSVSVHPNPSFNNTGFTISCFGNFSYEIANLQGTVLSKGTANNQVLVTSTLPKGVIYLTIKTSDGILIQKIVKQ